MGDLVQAILVPKGDHPHEDVVMAVASASVKALLYSNTPDKQAVRFELGLPPIWNEWLAGPFTKTVRRATITQFDDAIEHAVAVGRVGEVDAIATVPMRYEEFPKCIAKAQVQGTDYERRESWATLDVVDGDPHVAINPYVAMTTGKAAAQVAHGLMAFVIRQPEAWVTDWVKRGCPWTCWQPDQIAWAEAQDVPRHPLIKINDAGHTEVEPGTLTVIAW